MAKTVIAFGDMHVPDQNEKSVDIIKQVVRLVKPDITLMLGDMLDCKQFATHAPTWGVDNTCYESDLKYLNDFIDYCQEYTKERTVIIEGNHENRLDRWAASTSEGRGAYNMLAPRLQVSRGRKKFTYIPYGSADGNYPHYKLNSRTVAVHGWSYAINATKNHMRMGQGKSVLHGHSHRMDISIGQNVWGSGTVQARSAGCLCNRIPTYGTGSPVEWVNGFIVGYLGKNSDSFYNIDIKGDFCIMPDGKEIKSKV